MEPKARKILYLLIEHCENRNRPDYLVQRINRLIQKYFPTWKLKHLF